MKRVTVILAALCVAFIMAATATANRKTDWVTRGLLCIHGGVSYGARYGTGEGAWNANTGNGYYGGLQMDYSFMQAYGPSFLRRWGTADHWPVWAQLQAGRNGYRARGWYPWPNTARACGLL